jgi:hypothetical protein
MTWDSNGRNVVDIEENIMSGTIRRRRFVLALLVIAAVAGITLRVRGSSQTDLKTFMRQKLSHSQKLLEGLTLEDYNLVGENARALRDLSQDTRWRVSPNVNYLRMSAEFQDLADEISAKAKQRNLDGATLAYVRMTMSCVKCHQYTRENRLTLREPSTGTSRF